MRSGEVLKKLRKERNISQKKLSEGICTRSTLGTFENHGSHFSVQNCIKLLDRLNVRSETYFNLLSEDSDNKRERFHSLKYAMSKENINVVSEFNSQFKEQYKMSQDHYWFNLYFLSEEFLSQSDGSFTYEKFKKTHKSDIDIMRTYLYKVSNWGHYEFSVFTNSIWYFDFEFVQLIKNRLEKNFATTTEYKKTLYGKFLLNIAFYCLEYGYFSVVEEIKKELFDLSIFEDIHWKIIGTFQLALAQELSGNPSNSIKNALHTIQIYSQLGEVDYYNNIIEYRERLLEKHGIKA